MIHPQEVLENFWGYTEFLYPQKEIIDSLLSGQDALAILPTGGGKSLCYQLPALMLPGITMVISPLIALMHDQIEDLNQRDIPAAAITSQLSREEIYKILDDCYLGKIKLLYIAPERLQSRSFLQALQNIDLSQLAVDEAHCIAQWGFDFRPAYLKINKVRELFPNCPILALTATAPPKTVKEIIENLNLKNPKIFKTSLKRKNLVFKVKESQNELDDLVYELNKNPGSSIVFVRTRKKTFEVSEFLNAAGIDADYFHAGLSKEEKDRKQHHWMESTSQVMVATNAFGMGIDKSNVRSVIHLNLPRSLEAYVQEAGRAGRDGLPSEAVLFLQPYEVEETEEIFKSGLPTRSEFKLTERMFFNYLEIGENERPENKLEFQLNRFINKFNLNYKKTEKALSFLERKEVIRFQNRSGYSTVRIYTNPKNIQYSKSIPSDILEVLVRKYPGILSEDRAISEFDIAYELKKSVKNIVQHLERMNDAGYIEYLSFKIQLVEFLRPRESNYIENTLWKEFREQQLIQWKRLQDMIYFVSQEKVCREKLILSYFGEKPKMRCGKCDVCLQEDQIISRDELLTFLKGSSKTIQEILLHFSSHPRENILNALQILLDENKISHSGIDSYINLLNS